MCANRFGPLAALFLLLSFIPTAPAVERLRPCLREMSDEVARVLKARNEAAVEVGTFTGPGGCGQGIRNLLIEELRGRGLQVRAATAVQLRGSYREVRDDDTMPLALRIQAQLAGQKFAVAKFDKLVEDRAAVAQALGVTKPDFGAGVSALRESDELEKLIQRPVAVIAPEGVKAAGASPYGLALHVKGAGDAYAARPANLDGGRAFVTLRLDDVFAVHLANDSDHDAAVELLVDGINAFAFHEKKGYRHFLVPRKGKLLVRGWPRTDAEADEFVLTHYAKSGVAELGRPSQDVGTVTAVFSAAWGADEKPPRDEGGQSRDPFEAAVGRGNRVQAPLREVTRTLGRVRDTVTLRYRKAAP